MKILVLGASENEERYSNRAIKMLVNAKYEVVAHGRKKGTVSGVDIVTEKLPFADIDTVTVYLNAKNQEDFYDYILSLQPRRVIFNPGTENNSFSQLLDQNNIIHEEACTLVLLSTNQF